MQHSATLRTIGRRLRLARTGRCLPSSPPSRTKGRPSATNTALLGAAYRPKEDSAGQAASLTASLRVPTGISSPQPLGCHKEESATNTALLGAGKPALLGDIISDKHLYSITWGVAVNIDIPQARCESLYHCLCNCTRCNALLLCHV
jgi:hypothetical protein